MKYKLKIGEQWEGDALNHYPHYCPNCGESLQKPISFWIDSHRPSTAEEPFKGVGYDCYCKNCHWSGDILPNADKFIVEERMELSKFVKLKP